jgi:hypothetical protein
MLFKWKLGLGSPARWKGLLLAPSSSRQSLGCS